MAPLIHILETTQTAIMAPASQNILILAITPVSPATPAGSCGAVEDSFLPSG